MVRHIVSWSFVPELSEEERRARAAQIKRDAEALRDIVDGVLELRVIIDPLPSSNADLMLDSLFESEQALDAYQVHPEHVKLGGLIKGATQNRVCIDFTE